MGEKVKSKFKVRESAINKKLRVADDKLLMEYKNAFSDYPKLKDELWVLIKDTDKKSKIINTNMFLTEQYGWLYKVNVSRIDVDELRPRTHKAASYITDIIQKKRSLYAKFKKSGDGDLIDVMGGGDATPSQRERFITKYEDEADGLVDLYGKMESYFRTIFDAVEILLRVLNLDFHNENIFSDSSRYALDKKLICNNEYNALRTIGYIRNLLMHNDALTIVLGDNENKILTLIKATVITASNFIKDTVFSKSIRLTFYLQVFSVQHDLFKDGSVPDFGAIVDALNIEDERLGLEKTDYSKYYK